MARGRGYPLRRSAGVPRRETEWISGSIDWNDFTASQNKNLVSFTQAELRDLVPFTIVRTVGLVVYSRDFDTITNQDFLGAVGGGVVQESARATAGAVPNPFSDAENDLWFYHQFFAAQYEGSSGVDLQISQQFMIDSKAQRKVVDGEAIIFRGEGGGGSDGFDLTFMIRLLCKLH